MIGLLVGRFHALTREQATWLFDFGDVPVEHLVCVVTSAEQSGTRRNPLDLGSREAMLRPVLEAAGVPFSLVPLADVPDDGAWVGHLLAEVERVTGFALQPGNTRLRTANVEVAALFGEAGFEVALHRPQVLTPLELVQRMVDGRPWRDEAAPSTVAVYERDGLVERLRAIYSQRLINDDGELAEHRDFETYSAGMDASLAQKIEDVQRWIVPGRIVDKGCGTGKLMQALSRFFPRSSFVGVDLSREFLRRSDQNHYASDDVTLVFGDASEVQVEPGTATTVLFASIMHEIYSYNGYDLGHVQKALRSAARELKPGGRIIVRDGVSPGEEPCRMRLLTDATREVWTRFAREFKQGRGAPHEVLPDGRIRLARHLANEFLCKKDYLQNWAIEVHEEYGALTPEGWRDAFDAAGFDTVAVVAYVNPWIEANRYRGTVELFGDDDRPLGWFPTNVVAVGERRPPRGDGARPSVGAA